MAGRSQPPRSDKNSVKYKWNPLKGEPFELCDFSHERYSPVLSENNKQNSDKSELKSSKILSTSELISAVGQVWDYTSRFLAVSKPKANLKDGDISCQNEDIVHILDKTENGEGVTSADSKHFSGDVRTACCISHLVQSNLKLLKVTQRMSVCKTWGENCTHSFPWRFLLDRSNMPIESWKGKGLPSVEIPYELQHIYGWVSEMLPAGLECHVKFTKIGNRNSGECYIQTDKVRPSEKNVSGVTTNSANNLYTGSDDLHPDLLKYNGSSSNDDAKEVVNTRIRTSLCSDYLLGGQDTEADGSILRTRSSSLYADNHDNSSAPGDREFQESKHRTGDDELLENKRKQFEKYATENETREEISPQCDISHYALAKQEHAFAGALAGVCVSLCLHPVDTVKTVIQSCRADQKSICYIGRSIVSERGLTGLYRGIASNIASSAPISAVYTFTYESVKGALVPIFSKEYQSFAHCIAGGCASIATSFIFTPSDCIKQQMQVGSHYQNCWNALVGIIGKGGLSSLYAGWGAVLCRNVPHSIIKFYVYENLKQFMVSSFQSNAHAQPSTSQTLVCGGLAGSTAAFFTTPFDVVKTRLQTQIPGSVSQYGSVFHAIQEIGKHEGLKGLYRGLTPRLVMYMSQGALFFASYESFKRLFALQVPQQSTT